MTLNPAPASGAAAVAPSDGTAPVALSVDACSEDERQRVVECAGALHSGISSLTLDLSRCQIALLEFDAVQAHMTSKKRELVELEEACQAATRKVGRLVVADPDAAAAPPALPAAAVDIALPA